MVSRRSKLTVLCSIMSCMYYISMGETLIKCSYLILSWYWARVNSQAFLGLWLVEGIQLWNRLHRPLGSCGVSDTLGATQLCLITPRIYHIHHSFLGIYLSLIQHQARVWWFHKNFAHRCHVTHQNEPWFVHIILTANFLIFGQWRGTFSQGPSSNEYLARIYAYMVLYVM